MPADQPDRQYEKRTGRPPTQTRNLDENQRIGGITIPGRTYRQLSEDAEKRKTTIGLEAARLIMRAQNLEDVFSRSTLDATQLMHGKFTDAVALNRMFATGLQLAEETKVSADFEVAMIGIVRALLSYRRCKTRAELDRLEMKIGGIFDGFRDQLKEQQP